MATGGAEGRVPAADDVRSCAVMQQTAVVPAVFSYNAVISACEKGHQWQQALSVLAATQLTAVVPDVISCNAAISACEKGLQGQQALCVLAVMHQTAVMPDVIHVTSPSVLVRTCRRTS